MSEGHGGKRTGAGRRAVLNAYERLLVGAKAQQLQEKVALRPSLSSFREAKRIHGLDAAQALNRSILKAGGPLHYEKSYEGQDARDEVNFALAEVLGDPEMVEPPRYIQLAPRRYRTRAYVHRVVSRWATWRFRRPVTERRVRECWAEYSSFLKET